ncbi:TerB family tellurite resistance protein [Undibacter mobilis]|uniref:TerB family tellurite resistance protein n=1 Tax=Undibacter mobilis TaxID=2292256 RepID=A0A371B9B6_9BRAD|nr:TerB family tellurite resistance protein [Undibacter mobilis]RDV03971.1 TerB family tellurite resistance protein [Undibacter mobilis]
MFDAIMKFIGDLSEDDSRPEEFAETDYRLAAAALLVHTAAIDGGISDSEHVRLHDLIKERFKLDDKAADKLIMRAEEADEKAIDLYQFTTRLNRALDDKQRARVVEMMWQVVFADGKVTEFEDNLIWRAADLLHVSREERIALKTRVAAAQGTDE